MASLTKCYELIDSALKLLRSVLTLPPEPGRGEEWGREREREREWEREREREAKQLRRRLRKQLTLLKDVITRDVLLTKNLHSLREYLRFNLRDWSHSLTLSAGHASLRLVFGIVRLVHLGRAVRNCL
jgi:hypothetical protein